VTLTRTGGATADVQLELVGLPEHVAGSFSPMILSGPVTAATLTLEVDPAATAGTHDFKVLATGSGLAAETDVALTVSDLDLTGTVYLVDGRPWAGIGVEGPTG